MSRNHEVAALLEEYADLLEAKDVEYKPRSYRRAAENILEHGRAIEDLAAEGPEAVAEIEGVGEAISAKIVEYFETGEVEEIEELREELPVDMEALTRIEGVGPKSVGTLYEALGITSLEDLESAAQAGDIQSVSGFGPKTEQNILDGIDFARQAQERQLLGEALPRGDAIREYLEAEAAVARCELAGSIRRWQPTIGDVDVLVGSEDPETVVDAFTAWEQCDTVIEAGTSKASIRVAGVRVDLRIVAPEEFGSALQYFTGSVDHNVALRNRALDRDLKVNEYGVFDVSDVDDPDADQRVGERIAGETESGMYEAVELAWIPPELRENRGELEAAAEGSLPELVEPGDIAGDFHMHTEWSDGMVSIEEMARAAADFGHEFICITDHAAGPGIVGGVGLEDEEIREQLATIRQVDVDHDIRVFAGIEANIDEDGEIGIAEDVLADLDVVIASPHTDLDGDGTERLVTAAKHPEVSIIGHPSGRMLNRRAGLDLDVSRLASVAAEHDTALEINGNPSRLDLRSLHVQTAIEEGATIAVNTDAHRPSSFGYIRLSVRTARRGWAEAADVLNTWSLSDIEAFLE